MAWVYTLSYKVAILSKDKIQNSRLATAWDWITPQGEHTGTYTKILQGPNETHADFLARLETAISHTVIGEEAKRQLEKSLAYENANQECQKAIAPIRETGTIIIWRLVTI